MTTETESRREIEDSLVDLIDGASGSVAELSAKISVLVESYGPEASGIVLAAARVSALDALITQMTVTALLIASSATCIYGLRRYFKEQSQGAVSEAIFFLIIPPGAVAIAMAGAFFKVLSPWPIVGLFEPTLWLAHKVLGL